MSSDIAKFVVHKSKNIQRGPVKLDIFPEQLLGQPIGKFCLHWLSQG